MMVTRRSSSSVVSSPALHEVGCVSFLGDGAFRGGSAYRLLRSTSAFLQTRLE